MEEEAGRLWWVVRMSVFSADLSSEGGTSMFTVTAGPYAVEWRTVAGEEGEGDEPTLTDQATA